MFTVFSMNCVLLAPFSTFSITGIPAAGAYTFIVTVSLPALITSFPLSASSVVPAQVSAPCPFTTFATLPLEPAGPSLTTDDAAPPKSAPAPTV